MKVDLLELDTESRYVDFKSNSLVVLGEFVRDGFRIAERSELGAHMLFDGGEVLLEFLSTFLLFLRQLLF